MLQHHSCVGDQRDSSSSKLWSPVTCSATLKWVDTVSHRRYTLGGKCRWSTLVAVFVLLRVVAVVVKTVCFPVLGTKRIFASSRASLCPVGCVCSCCVCCVMFVEKCVCVCVLLVLLRVLCVVYDVCIHACCVCGVCGMCSGVLFGVACCAVSGVCGVCVV